MDASIHANGNGDGGMQDAVHAEYVTDDRGNVVGLAFRAVATGALIVIGLTAGALVGKTLWSWGSSFVNWALGEDVQADIVENKDGTISIKLSAEQCDALIKRLFERPEMVKQLKQVMEREYPQLKGTATGNAEREVSFGKPSKITELSRREQELVELDRLASSPEGLAELERKRDMAERAIERMKRQQPQPNGNGRRAG